MKLTKLKFDGAYVIEPKVFGDSRGYFMEAWSEQAFGEAGLNLRFVQDNESFTARRGTLRGLHFQLDPASQGKLVRVITGAALDVIVDLRKGSPTYLQWEGVELSSGNHRQLLVPRGFGHGFLTLTEDVTFSYKVDAPYCRELDRSIRFDDPAIGVDWGIADPILSDKDQNAPLLAQSDCNFVYTGR